MDALDLKLPLLDRLRLPSGNRDRDGKRIRRRSLLGLLNQEDLHRLERFQDREFGEPIGKIHGPEIRKMARGEFRRFNEVTGFVHWLGQYGFKIRDRISNASNVGTVGGAVNSTGSGPSPQYVDRRESGWMLPTWMIYPDAAGSVYARNWRGDTVPGGTYPLTSQAVWNDLVNRGRGGWIHVKGSDYNMGIATPAVTLATGGFKFTGEGHGFNSNLVNLIQSPNTRFLQGIANQTLFKWNSTLCPAQYEFSDFAFHTNGFTGGIGCDMSYTGTEGSTDSSVIRKVAGSNNTTGAPAGQFNYVFNLDKNEDLVVQDFVTALQGGPLTSISANADFHWDANAGNARFEHILSSSDRLMIGSFQTCACADSTLRGVQLAATNTTSVLALIACYLANGSQNSFSNVDCNGFALTNLIILGGLMGANNVPLLTTGAGSILNVGLLNVNIWVIGGTVNLVDTPANLGTNSAIAQGCKVVHGALNSASPWTLNGNLLTAPVAAAQAVGASPATITNNSPFKRLYNWWGGTVSGVTKGGITISATSPGSAFLERGESLIITYSVLPTMAFMPMAD